MTSTSMLLTPHVRKKLAQGSSAGGCDAELWTFGALAGAGAFYSNVDDMMKFVVANIENSLPISATLKSMQQVTDNQLIRIGWMSPGFIERLLGNSTSVWHNGMVGGYASYIAVDQSTRTGIVVLSSKAVDITMLGIMLMRQARTQSWQLDYTF